MPQTGGGLSELYIATGTDHQLWVSNGSTSFALLASVHVYCIGNPTAYVDGAAGNATLHVACLGSDHAVWYGVAPVNGTSIPTITSFVSLGGRSNYGPALATVNGTPTVFVVGTDTQLWAEAVGGSWSPFLSTHCQGHPAASSAAGSAFIARHGGDGALWISANTGSGFGPFTSAGGRLIDGPGLADEGGQALAVVEGVDGHLWATNIDEAGDTTGWSFYGGNVLGGASAAGATQ